MMNSHSTALSWVTSLAAAATLTGPLLAVQVATAELVDLPALSSGLGFFGDIAGDDSGSWVLLAFTNSITPVHYGVLAGSGVSTPAILRTPQTIAGVEQRLLSVPRVRGDNIGYLSRGPLTQANRTSAWINDTLLATPGTPVGAGLEWVQPEDIRPTDSDTFVSGSARPAGIQGPRQDIVVRYPSGSVVYSSDTPLPGIGDPAQFGIGLNVSPSGNHWTGTIIYTSATTQQGERAVLLDGAVHSINGGTTPLTTEHTNFTSFTQAFVDDSGVVTYVGIDSVSGLSGTYRNGFRLQFNDRVRDIDARGRTLLNDGQAFGLGASIDGVFLDRVGTGGLDVDGDGLADPGFRVRSDPGSLDFPRPTAFIDQGQVLVLRLVAVPGVGLLPGVLKARYALPDVSICEGETNGIGLRATIRVLGNNIVPFDDLELQLTNIPLQATVLPIFSRTQGFAANPGGSAGNLCLGGAIGRGAPTANLSGQLNFSRAAFPSQFPQPTGPVAVQPGETWYFQAWYLDGPSGGSNFTNAVAVMFQ